MPSFELNLSRENAEKTTGSPQNKLILYNSSPGVDRRRKRSRRKLLAILGGIGALASGVWYSGKTFLDSSDTTQATLEHKEKHLKRTISLKIRVWVDNGELKCELPKKDFIIDETGKTFTATCAVENSVPIGRGARAGTVVVKFPGHRQKPVYEIPDVQAKTSTFTELLVQAHLQ